MSQIFKISKDYHNYLANVTENIVNAIPDSSNQKLWIEMGKELEVCEVPKEQISTIMRKDIEQILYDKVYHEFGPREGFKWHNNTYWLVTKAHGWTNPEMARHVDPTRIKEIVPYKNPKMKDLCYDLINLCRILIEKSKEGESFEDQFGEKQMNEFYKQRHAIINNCKNAIDSKTKVPKNTEIFLLECLATVLGNTNKCAAVFMEQNLMRLREQGKFFTLKQATKFQKGMKQSQQFILKPSSRDPAIYLDYTGEQCKNINSKKVICNSFRIRQKENSYKLECFDCGNILPQGHISKCTHCKIPLYKERLLHIVKTNKCENCNEIVDLPQELIEYAKS